MFNNSVSNNKQFIIKTLLNGAIALIVVALLLSFFLPQNIAYADTEESYINFNQLVYCESSTNDNISLDNPYTIKINNTLNASYYVSTTNFNFINNHKYYLGVTTNLDNYCAFASSGSAIKYFKNSQIFSVSDNYTINRIYFYSNETAKTFSIKLIDLTQCFGESVANNLTIIDVNNLFPSTYYSYTLSNLLPLSSLTNQEYYDKGYKDGQAQNNNVVYSSSVSNVSLDNTRNQNVDYIGNLNYNGSITYTTKNNEKFWRIFLDGITLKTATKYTLKWEYLSTTNSNLESALLRYTDSNYSNEVADIFESSSGELSFYYYSDYDFEWLSLDLATTDDSGITNITFKLTITAVNDISMAYDLGYEDGEDVGYNTGYSVGYDKGYSEGNYNGIQHNTNTLNGSFWSFLSSMFSSISNLLHIELYDGITIGVVIMIPLLFTILMLILKLVRG